MTHFARHPDDNRDGDDSPAARDRGVLGQNREFNTGHEIGSRFDGAYGVLTCVSQTCTINMDDHALTEMTGWAFVPKIVTDGQGGSRSPQVLVEDTDYRYFGYWLRGPDHANGGGYDIYTFAGGSEPYTGDTGSLTGRATYRGPAAGLYVKDADGGSSSTGQFTATVTLHADFGSKQTISGSMGDFRDGSRNLGWSLGMGSTSINASKFSGTTHGVTYAGQNPVGQGDVYTGSAGNIGSYDGAFYGSTEDNNYPYGVTGTFTGTFDDGAVIGGFGASQAAIHPNPRKNRQRGRRMKLQKRWIGRLSAVQDQAHRVLADDSLEQGKTSTLFTCRVLAPRCNMLGSLSSCTPRPAPSWLRVLSLATFKAICTLACLAALFLAAQLEAQEARSHLSSDPRINHAGTLIQADRFTEALSILRPLASSDHPDQVDVLFLVGLAALGAAQSPETPESERKGYLDEAIAAFHKILVGRPELARVRLELARAFYVKGDDGLSQKHFEQVLAGNPHPAVAGNIRRFLAVIRRRRRWKGYFGATLAPDGNINAASDAKTVDLWGFPFTPDQGPRSGVGVVLWGG
ncbi:MAG: hypothetical protein F4162_07900 [Synechococcus sp. SB0676_bin_10]|uniref:Tetratricopeptide repeat protein n=1 Tax=Synechococcus sp. SB0676_bin_10 TaxID=2604869 RepID=A0A6B1F677_9SYNE|nr:hypothetical protein [Synechococcus sp. SB0676_bin_10]